MSPRTEGTIRIVNETPSSIPVVVRKIASKELFRHEGAFPLSLHKLSGRDKFMVKYGEQSFIGKGLEASHHLGECLMHLLACEGKLDY